MPGVNAKALLMI